MNLTFNHLDLSNRYDFLSSLPKHFQLAAEIGVWTGDYSYEILNRTNMMLYSIDLWYPTPTYNDPVNEHTQRYMQTLSNLNSYGSRSVIVKKRSIDAALMIKDNSLDFIYIDGEHTYEALSQDIYTWWPKLKAGGVFAGHDYDERAPGVIRTIGEFAKYMNQPFRITGVGGRAKRGDDAHSPSWVFIK